MRSEHRYASATPPGAPRCGPRRPGKRVDLMEISWGECLDWEFLGECYPIYKLVFNTKNLLISYFLGGMSRFTLWQTYKKLLKMAIEIVDLPIKKGDVP